MDSEKGADHLANHESVATEYQRTRSHSDPAKYPANHEAVPAEQQEEERGEQGERERFRCAAEPCDAKGEWSEKGFTGE